MSEDKIQALVAEDAPCPDSLHVVLDNKLYLKHFRKFLRGHLALENLLFYESVALYKQLTDTEKRNKAAKFLINQFVLEESEDPINLPGSQRHLLQKTENFASDTFDEARNSIFHLMEDNYLTFFWEYLKGKRGVTLSVEDLKSKLLPETYFLNLSFDNISERLNEDKNGDLVFITCSCKPIQNEENGLSIACCEKGRIRTKISKHVSRNRQYSLDEATEFEDISPESSTKSIMKSTKTNRQKQRNEPGKLRGRAIQKSASDEVKIKDTKNSRKGGGSKRGKGSRRVRGSQRKQRKTKLLTNGEVRQKASGPPDLRVYEESSSRREDSKNSRRNKNSQRKVRRRSSMVEMGKINIFFVKNFNLSKLVGKKPVKKSKNYSTASEMSFWQDII